MRIKLNKWGNSWGIRLPGMYLKELGIGRDEIIDITLEKDMIILKKAATGLGGKYRLADLLAKVQPGKLHGESWADSTPSGNETW